MTNFRLDDFILTLMSQGFKYRVSTLYQLLIGKRTLSIISFGLFYDCLSYIGIFPNLKKKDYQLLIADLVKKGYLLHEEEYVWLSPEGERSVKDSEEYIASLKINQLIYGKVDQTYFDFLRFATQVLSELAHKNGEYLPLESNPYHQWQLKKWLSHHLGRTEKVEFLDDFQKEWTQMIVLLNEDEADFITNQLSGHKQSGKTFEQLGEGLNLSRLACYLYQKSCLHHLLTLLTTQKESFPLFNEIYQLLDVSIYNQSALMTYQMYAGQRDLQKLSLSRKLKLSTINEHMLEFAILDEKFPVKDFITKDCYKRLESYRFKSEDWRDWRLSDVQREIPEVSFFIMRLYQIQIARREYDGSTRQTFERKVWF